MTSNWISDLMLARGRARVLATMGLGPLTMLATSLSACSGQAWQAEETPVLGVVASALTTAPAPASGQGPVLQQAFLEPAKLTGDFTPAGGWDPALHPRMLGDVNGDGKGDIIGFGDAGVWLALSTASGLAPSRFVVGDFGYNQGWRMDKHLRLLADLNHDGRSDLVAFGDDGVWTDLASANGFTEHHFVLQEFGYNQGWRVDENARLLGDVNGDGFKDIVAFGEAGVWLALGAGAGGFQPATFVLAGLGAADGWHGNKHLRLIADINRDGKDDIVAFGDAGVWTALSTGSSFAAPRYVLADFGTDQGWSGKPRFVLDIDQDGWPEIVGVSAAGKSSIARATGDGGFAPIDYALPGDWSLHAQLADLNGDGYPDLLDDRSGDVRRALGGPGGFQAPERALIFFANEPLQISDIDGDGKQDLVRFGTSPDDWSSADTQWARSVAAPIPAPPARVAGVTTTNRSATSLSFQWSYASPTRFLDYVRVQPVPTGPLHRITWSASQSTYSFTDTGLNPNTEYCYQVDAMSWFGGSGPTRVCATTLAAPGGGGGGGGGNPFLIYVCGTTLFCPAGYHPHRYLFSSSCEGSSIERNQTECAVNSGLSFSSCGLNNCPAGWRMVDTYFDLNCAEEIGSSIDPNTSVCVPNPNSSPACVAAPSAQSATTPTSDCAPPSTSIE